MQARFPLIQAAALVAAFLYAPSTYAQEGEPTVPRTPAVVSFSTENDFFGGGTDRNYSNGLRIERVSGADNVHPGLEWVADRLPWIDLDRTELRQGFAISHAIFTPEDIQTFTPDPTDRPYAAWLALSSTVAASSENTQDTLQVNLGVVGPSAAGEFVQNTWHEIIGVATAKGWDHQLKDEPGVEVIAQRMQMFDGPNLPLGLETDFGAHVGVALGNVRTYGSAGLTARIGWDLNSSFGPPRIRPALSGAGEVPPPLTNSPCIGVVPPPPSFPISTLPSCLSHGPRNCHGTSSRHPGNALGFP